MFSQKKRTKLSFPAPSPSNLCMLEAASLPDWEPGPLEGQACRQPRPEGTSAHCHPQGKLGERGSPSHFFGSPGSKSNPKTQRKESHRPSLQLLTKSLILASI